MVICLIMSLYICLTGFTFELKDSNAASASTEATDETTKDETAEKKVYDISKEKIKVYFKGNYGSEDEEIDMYFLNGNKQIAYYDMDTVVYLMTKLYRDGYGDYEKDKKYELNYSVTGDGNVLFTRENDFSMLVDFDADKIIFDDYDMFTNHSYDMTTVDLSHSSGFNEKGEAVYLKRNDDLSLSRFGKFLTFDLDKYGIDLISQNGCYYIQAQTMADILLGATYTEYLYNGKCGIYANYVQLNADLSKNEGLAKVFYLDDPEARSQELIDYTYNELCMILDQMYGLKANHNIVSFKEYFAEIGLNGRSLEQMLKSEDPVEYEKALFVLTQRGLDDLHSTYRAPGAYAGINCIVEVASIKTGASTSLWNDAYKDFFTVRNEAFGGSVPAYQEVGNTAYITFDSFLPMSRDYYSDPPTDDNPGDTVGLLIYAHSQIKRENSPIKNVVIDLTCNGGGAEDAVAFVCSWFLGDAQIYLQDSMTDASSVNVYSCDANLDHQFDQSDSVSDLNLYCLISPVSFSCGNLAPCVFACSGKVTLIGQMTGGGSCIVLPLTTASGSVIQVSGYMVISALKNGSFYNSDMGVNPDIFLTKTESFYDRKTLTDYINNLK